MRSIMRVRIIGASFRGGEASVPSLGFRNGMAEKTSSRYYRSIESVNDP
jgi:hypothetical protein